MQRRQRKLLLGWVGGLLLVLIFVGFGTRIGLAAFQGEAFVGTNYKGVPIGTFTGMAVLLAFATVAVVELIRKARRRGR